MNDRWLTVASVLCFAGACGEARGPETGSFGVSNSVGETAEDDGDEDEGSESNETKSSNAESSGASEGSEEETTSASGGGSSGSEEATTDDDDGPPEFRLDVASPGTLETGITTESCADAEVVITPGEATIMLLIDRSGTMRESFGAGNLSRWDAVADALFGANSVVSSYESEVQFGMALYTNDGDASNECPDLVSVEPMFNNFSAMEEAFGVGLLEGKADTPTAESLRDSAALLEDLDDGSSKAILLVTDGEPDSCAVPDGNVVPQRGGVIEQVDMIFNEMGIPVFVIAIANSEFNAASYDHLQDVANVGVGAARYFNDPDEVTANDDSNEDWVDTRTPDQPGTLYTVENIEELGTAFGTLISNFVPCDFTLNGEVDLDRQCQGTVMLDGQALECGVDWEVSDPSTLSLLPSACAVLQDGQNHDVSANFPCEIFAPG